MQGRLVACKLPLCEQAGGPARSEPAGATEQAVAYLKTAASGKRLPPAQVLAAILALEKAKLPVRTLCACTAAACLLHANPDHPAGSAKKNAVVRSQC